MENYILNSGGAYGADTFFGLTALDYGISPDNQNHWFYGEQSKWNAPNGNIRASEEDMREASYKMAEAAKFMYGYAYPIIKDVRILRNYCQVKYSEAIFAVGIINQKGDKAFPNQRNDTRILLHDCVVGGTGYAIARAILDKKPVYVYCLKQEDWCTYNYSENCWEFCDIPKLTKHFAGIGTRNLNEKGKQAIKHLFANTFN